MKIKHVSFNGNFTECNVTLKSEVKHLHEVSVLFVPVKRKKYKHGWMPKGDDTWQPDDFNKCGRAIRRALKHRRARALQEVKDLDIAIGGKKK